MTPTINRWRNVNEAAAHIRSTKSTLDKLRVSGDGPRYSKIGGRVIYDVNDLDAWADERKRISTSEEVAA